MAQQTKIPCVLMRGGTSKGPLFRAEDLPEDPALRDRVLLAIMGSPDLRQIDGIGGADPLTSKVAIVSRSQRRDADIDYFFCQVNIANAIVDSNPTCGNMLAAVGPFAIESGLIPAHDGETAVRIHSVNTGGLTEALIRTPGGRVEYDGEAAIDGVPGTAAPVILNFMNVSGSKTGRMLPTGKALEEILGVPVTCIDVAMPMVIMPAASVGKSGHESKKELDGDAALFQRIEAIRLEAGRRMGLGDVTGKVIPKIGLLAPPRAGGTVASRYFVPDKCHAAYAVTGAVCVASCVALSGSVADGIAIPTQGERRSIVIEHPTGSIQVELQVAGAALQLDVQRGGVVRTARRLFEGRVCVPAAVWSGR
jgi:4-oxalomesaconate tautomerase